MRNLLLLLAVIASLNVSAQFRGDYFDFLDRQQDTLSGSRYKYLYAPIVYQPDSNRWIFDYSKNNINLGFGITDDRRASAQKYNAEFQDCPCAYIDYMNDVFSLRDKKGRDIFFIVGDTLYIPPRNKNGKMAKLVFSGGLYFIDHDDLRLELSNGIYRRP
jgi:hypothetical protein